MGRVVVNNSVTLDGVMQAPGRPDEDRRGGFEHGGWAQPNFDSVMGDLAGEGMANTGAFLFGRRTYRLLIHPLVLGSGRHLFVDAGPTTALRLVDTKTTTTGVVIATYQPANRR